MKTALFALAPLPGCGAAPEVSVEVDTQAGTAVVTYDGQRVTAEKVARTVTDARSPTTVSGAGG